MTQLNLFDLALPTVWKVNCSPKEDGKYMCRVKLHDGDIKIREVDFFNQSFLLGDGGSSVLAWR